MLFERKGNKCPAFAQDSRCRICALPTCPGWALRRVLPARLWVPAGQGLGRNPARPAAAHQRAELQQDAARVLQLVMLALSCSSQAPWGSREPWQIHVLFLQFGIINLGWFAPKGAGILYWAEKMEMTMSSPDETIL